MNTQNLRHTLAYCVLTVSSAPESGWSPEHESWLHECALRTRHPLDAAGTSLAPRHPLYSHVVGFACGRLELAGSRFRLADLQLTVGSEAQCMHGVKRAFAHAQICKLHYSPWSWTPRYLWTRMAAWAVASGTAMPDITGNEIALAEMVSLGGLVGTPPLHLAIEALNLGRIARPLPDVAIRELLAVGDHELICRQLLQELWATAAVYVRMYFGTAYSVAHPAPLGEIPPGGGETTGAELSPES